jgi:hypothetical protein
MKATDIPVKFPIPFGNNAGPGFIRPIPVASQIGVNNGFASLTDGFPPLNAQPIAAGGVPPFEQDANGILFESTSWDRWFSAGGPVNWDSTFANDPLVGGYPKGAIVGSNLLIGKRWMSTVDDNTADPDALSTTGWTTAPGLLPSGTPVPSFSTTVPWGFVAANGLTIGNTGSNATGLASPYAQLLFRYIWLNFSNAECPILASNGIPVSRGANPDIDFLANSRQLTLPNMKGIGFIGVDNMGGSASSFLSGVPITIGSTTQPGSILGENLHSLINNELPLTPLPFSGQADTISVRSNTSIIILGSTQVSGLNNGSFSITVLTSGSVPGFVDSTGGFTPHGTIPTFGGNGAHNTTERNMTGYWNLAL